MLSCFRKNQYSKEITLLITLPISEFIDYCNRYDNLKLLFPNIIKLICILICKPVSSVTCDRSFNGRRYKKIEDLAENSMSNERIHNLLLCHVHK